MVFKIGLSIASGYQNFPVEQASQQTLIQWHLVIKYFNTPGFLWEMTKFSLLGGLLLVIVKKLRNDFGPVETLVSGIAIFGLFLSRSALGRSDGYHLAFAWIPALLIIAYLLQFTNQLSKSISVAILCILIFFICRDTVQITLIQNQLIKFQTYGNPSGSYPSYTTKRSGIITGIETTPKEMDDLVTYIDSKVDKNENIFVFPQEPEIYFLTDRNNSTRFDTPTAFYTKKYQDQMVHELTSNPPKLVVYKRKFETQYFTNDTLHVVNEFIVNNYKVAATFGEELIMERN